MYPNTLTQLARANPFTSPLFTLQKVEEPTQSGPSHVEGKPRLAAAAVAGKKYLVQNINSTLLGNFL